MKSEGDSGKSGSAFEGNSGTSEGEIAPSPKTAPQAPIEPIETGARKAPVIGSTLVGTGMKFAPAKPSASNPPPIVPQRRTPAAGTARPPIPPGPSTKPSLSSRPPIPPGPPRADAGKSTTTKTISSVPPALKTLSSAPPFKAISSVPPPYADTVVAAGAISTEARTPIVDVVPKVTPAAGAPPYTSLPPAPNVDVVPPPMIRIPQGGLLGSSASMPPSNSPSMLCHVLVQKGYVTQAMVDRALAIQEERGGQIGRILLSLGACTEEQIARALIEQLRLRKDEGVEDDVSAAAREHKEVAGLRVLTRPWLTVATLLATDIFSLVLAALVASGVHWARTYADLGEVDWSSWLVVGPAIALCLLTYLGLELYSPMAKSTPDEIRDVVFATSLVHLGASLLSTLGDLPIVKWGVFVRAVWWVATMFLVPVIRSFVRNRLCVQPWWGIPVCVLGAAKTGRLIVRTLKAQPRSGLKPVMLLDDDATKHGTLRASVTNEVMDVYSVNLSAAHFVSESQRKALSDDIFGPDSDPSINAPISSDHIPIPSSRHLVAEPSDDVEFLGPESTTKLPAKQKEASLFPRGKFAEVDGVPLLGELSLAPILAHRLKIPYAVVAMPGVDGPRLLQIVERVGGKFSHLLVIPDLFGFATLGVPAKNLGGILGVEVRQQLLLPGPRLAKRVMDIALTSFGLFFVMPFLLLIALLIKLDSKGPVFYTQKRLGRDGEHFRAYKFRTMHGDGEERLKAILDADPALRAEYEIYHKLRKDPRVTRIGRVLRKFSLDEFPQLLNVILGDMSLVGPRPYIERELTEMNGQEKIILRAPPGMTGMWQVSDRNATSFAQRVQIDVYYVRNWSPWLDIHILAKTFGVVVRGSGV